MKILRAIGRVLTSGWFLGLIGALLLCVVIWIVGPMIPIGVDRPLAGIGIRLVIVLAILAIWAVVVLIFWLLRRRTDDRLVEEVAAASREPEGAVATREEVGLLGEKLREALATLRKTKLAGGRNYLYQLPWYILIGAPGAGKTTALVNSGLKFPLETGAKKIKGAGGTRACDWWFTDEAVLIDTAGRYTTQDSDQTVDAGAWLGFLDLLRKHRRRQPINGVILAISLPDIAGDATTRLNHARSYKLRLRELEERLGVRLPVYVIVTQADLIAGFVEFFDDIGREDREQVWGMTLPLDQTGRNAESVVGAFGPEYDLLVERLTQRSIDRLHAEPDIQRRSLIFGLPLQVASLREPLEEFLREIFQPSRLERPAMLRGVYLTSGTQEGTPIDRLLGTMSRAFGIGRQAIPAMSGGGRSYFLTRLLRQVVFREAGLVGTNARVERRRRIVAVVGYTLLGAILLGAGAAWAYSYTLNRQLIDDTRAGVARYIETVASEDLDTVRDGDPTRPLPALAVLRDLPAGPAKRPPDPPLAMTFGLYQGDKLEVQSRIAYQKALASLFQPRLLLRLEEQIGALLGNPGDLYGALAAYLMLGEPGRLDPETVRNVVLADWEKSYPGEANAPLRAELTGHLDALLAAPLAKYDLNGPLVAQARTALMQVPLAERGYLALQREPEIADLSPWRVVDHAGAAAARVFARASGKPLSDGIPGLYTRRAFHETVQPVMLTVVERTAADSWVLGPEAAAPTDDAGIALLLSDVLGLYLDDYANAWDDLLNDITIVPVNSLSHAAEILNSISGPNSPLRKLLVSVSEETQLALPPPGPEEASVEGVAEAAAETLSDAPTEVFEIASRVSPRIYAVRRFADLYRRVSRDTVAGVEVTVEPGQFVQDRFEDLHRFVGDPTKGGAPLDDLIALLLEAYRQVNRLAAGGSSDSVAATLANVQEGPIAQLRDEAGRLPQPIGGWIEAVVKGSSAVSVGSLRERINAEWRAEVLPFCQQALTDRYPFAQGRADVTLDDMARLFGPNGLVDGFFTRNLAPFVDTNQSPWQWKRGEANNLGIDDAVLAPFEQARQIRDALFAGGAGPKARFELVPVRLDQNASDAILEVDGQVLIFGQGTTRGVRMEWPGPGAGRASITINPGGAPVAIDGPWAWFRLIDAGSVSQSSLSDRFRASFSSGGMSAIFDVRAGSVLNPFNLPALRQFRCPEQL